MLENSSLRESLCNMEKELVSLLNERISELQNGNSSGQLEEVRWLGLKLVLGLVQSYTPLSSRSPTAQMVRVCDYCD